MPPFGQAEGVRATAQWRMTYTSPSYYQGLVPTSGTMNLSFLNYEEIAATDYHGADEPSCTPNRILAFIRRKSRPTQLKFPDLHGRRGHRLLPTWKASASASSRRFCRWPRRSRRRAHRPADGGNLHRAGTRHHRWVHAGPAGSGGAVRGAGGDGSFSPAVYHARVSPVLMNMDLFNEMSHRPAGAVRHLPARGFRPPAWTISGPRTSRPNGPRRKRPVSAFSSCPRTEAAQYEAMAMDAAWGMTDGKRGRRDRGRASRDAGPLTA